MANVECPICKRTNDAGKSVCASCGARLPETAGPAIVPGAGRGAGERAQGRDLRRGQVVANRYTVQSLLGRGGMGRIYQVHDNTLDEVVALKTLLPEHLQDPELVGRFFNEARIARGLSHPNIGRVHDIGVADETTYISMELIRGQSLRAVIEALPAGQRLSLVKVLQIFDELCSALFYAHDFTVHRDIKPENVMLDTDGKVKLLDFGISKLMSNPNYTATSMVMGTPYYMSPEQLRSSADVDARSDIYSLGVMLYEVITGCTPTGLAQPASHVTHNIPAALDAIIQKCLEPDPKDRYQNVDEMRKALAEIRATLDGDGPAPSLPSGKTAADRHGGYTGKVAAAVLLSLIVGGAVAGLWKAEAGRQTLLSETHPLSASSPAGALAVQRGVSASERFQALSQVLERAQLLASKHERSMTDEQAKSRAEELLADADHRWEAAQQEGAIDPGMAVSSGWNALHRYLAVIAKQEGMIYVPAGDVSLRGHEGETSIVSVDGFFIDEKPVSVDDFSRFSREHTWRWPNLHADYNTQPMTKVTYYDALAYASEQSPSKRIPSAAQWARAVSQALAASALHLWDSRQGLPTDAAAAVGQDDDSDATEESGGPGEALYLPHGGLEWTRSVALPFPYDQADGREEDSRPMFGSGMVVLGGLFGADGSYVLGPWKEAQYEYGFDYLGFRCVYELPRTLEAVSSLLDSRGE